MLALLLLIAQPADLDRIRAIRERTDRTVASAEALTLEIGDTLLVRASIPVDEARGRLQGTTTAVRVPRGIRVVPWLEIVDQKPGTVVVVYAIQAAPDRAPGTESIEVLLEVRDRAGRAVVKKPIAHQLLLVRPVISGPNIALDRDAALHHQQLAEAAHRKLDTLRVDLPLDRLVKPPPLSKVPESLLPEFKDFLLHRLRAESAELRLIAAANSEDPALELAAIHALGSLSSGPSGAAKQAHALEGLDSTAALELIAKKLNGLQLDEAEGMVLKLRNRGQLEKKELATALEVLGAIELARGDERSAERAFGQALCAEPGLVPVLKRRALAEAFAEAKRRNPCREPVGIGEVTVERDLENGELIYRITAEYSDDPYGLVESGDVQIWGTGGGMFAGARPPSTEKNGRKVIAGTIADSGKMETYGGQLLVKVFLRDISGVVLDSYGDPDPIALPIVEGENVPSVSVPWWVWVVAAGVAVAGAATVTAVVLAKDQEPPLGIGPIEVTF